MSGSDQIEDAWNRDAATTLLPLLPRSSWMRRVLARSALACRLWS